MARNTESRLIADSLTPARAAELSGAGRDYIYALIRAGTLEANAIAGRQFIKRTSFERWHEAYKVRRHVPRSEALQAGAPA